MNNSNICSMNISNLIFESMYMKVKAFMIPTHTIEGKIYKNILESIYDYNYIYNNKNQ